MNDKPLDHGVVDLLSGALRSSDDRKLVAVLPLIDALPARALADALLETVRPRLWLLRPPRRLSLRRILAVPLESLLAEPALCQPRGIRLPRSLLPALFGLVEPQLDPGLCTAVGEVCPTLTTAEVGEVHRFGRRLWPAAAQALQRAFADPRTSSRALIDRGIDPGPLGEHHGMVLALLERGEAIAAAMLPQDGRMPDPASGTAPHRAMLMQAATGDLLVWRALAASFLLRAPSPDVVVRMIARARMSLRRPQLMGVIEEVVASLSLELGQSAGITTPSVNGGDRRSEAGLRLSLILSELSQQGARLDALATEAGEALARQFAGTLDGAVLTPLQQLQAVGQAGTASVAAIEAAARAARRMEVAGRSMGRSSMFSPALAGARSRILDLARRCPARAESGGAVALPDLVRLMEILAGPDAALAMIDQLAAEA